MQPVLIHKGGLVPNLGLLLVAFHSTLLRSLFTSVSLCIVQYMENKHLRTIQAENNPLAIGAQRSPSALQSLWQFSLFLLQKKSEENPPSEPHQTLRRAAAQSTGDEISAVGQISSDQRNMKHLLLAFLPPSPSPKRTFFAFNIVAADRAAAGRCLQLSGTEGAQMRYMCLTKRVKYSNKVKNIHEVKE